MPKFLFFKSMLTPYIIHLFFWLMVVVCIVGGAYNFWFKAYVHGLQVLIVGPILARVICEFLILFFKIDQTLTELKNAVQEKS